MKSLEPALREACEELLRKESSVEPFFQSLFVDVPSAQASLQSVSSVSSQSVSTQSVSAIAQEETPKVAVAPPSPPMGVEEEDDFFLRVCWSTDELSRGDSLISRSLLNQS